MKRLRTAALAGAALTLTFGPMAGADPVAVTAHPAPSLAAGAWVNGAPTTLAGQRRTGGRMCR